MRGEQRGVPAAASSAARLLRRAQIVGSGKHVLGYVVIGHTGLLLLVEKARVAATLPGNHHVSDGRRWSQRQGSCLTWVLQRAGCCAVGPCRSRRS